jgi:hypothetical protein
VNLRAEEDAKTVQEEHDTLLHEKEDLEAAISQSTVLVTEGSSVRSQH